VLGRAVPRVRSPTAAGLSVGIFVLAQESGTRPMQYVGRLLVLALAIGLLAGVEGWRSYHQAISAAERQAESFTRLLAEQAERSIQAIDLTLIGLSDTLHVAPALLPNDAAFRETMKNRLQHLPYVRAMFVVGPDGFVIHGTGYPAPRIDL